MTTKLYLIKATNGKEAMLRLPTKVDGSLTPKAFVLVGNRFYDSTTGIRHGIEKALCIENFSSSEKLSMALEDFVEYPQNEDICKECGYHITRCKCVNEL